MNRYIVHVSHARWQVVQVDGQGNQAVMAEFRSRVRCELYLSAARQGGW